MFFVIRRIIKNPCQQSTRRKIGAFLSMAGVFFNLLLFLIKLYAGKRSSSIAITADAFNNLSDALSSLLLTAGFILSGMKENDMYPYGFGRIEYLSGLFFSGAVIFVGAKLFISSIEKLFRPQPITASLEIVCILLLSVLIKSYMFFYNLKAAKEIRSMAVKAAAIDSLSDCVATVAILLSFLFYRLFSCNIDGICGIMVAVCILYAGAASMKESALPLIGRGCDQKTLLDIRETARSYAPELQILRITVHDYGPLKKIINITVRLDQETATHSFSQLESILSEKLDMECAVFLKPQNP